MIRALRFLWNATRGHRLRPWQSPYLRWRLETYSGKPANEVQPVDFWKLMRTEPGQFVRFLLWAGKLNSH